MYVLLCVGPVTNDLVIYYAAVDKAKDKTRIQIHFTVPLKEFMLIVQYIEPHRPFLPWNVGSRHKILQGMGHNGMRGDDGFYIQSDHWLDITKTVFLKRWVPSQF